MPDLRENQYAAANVGVAATVAELRGFQRHVENSVAILLGATAAFDGTQDGVFVYDPADDTSDDGAATIKPTDVSGDGRWRKIV